MASKGGITAAARIPRLSAVGAISVVGSMAAMKTEPSSSPKHEGRADDVANNAARGAVCGRDKHAFPEWTPAACSNACLAEIADVFARYGNFTLGGGSATSAVIHGQIVTLRRWVNDQQFTLCFALGRLTPGTNVLAFCTVVSDRAAMRNRQIAARSTRHLSRRVHLPYRAARPSWHGRRFH
jgi:chromate transporter